jgi:hypothetical protein
MRIRRQRTQAAVLREILRLFRAPSRWTKRWWARDKYDANVSPHDRAAVCYCLIGAVHRVAASKPLGKDVIYTLLCSLRALHPRLTAVSVYNDAPSTTIKDIRAVVKHALRSVEAQPA